MKNNNNRDNNKGDVPPKNKNPNNNKDPSNNDVINPFLSPLHGCNEDKNVNNFVFPPMNNLQINNQRDLNDNKHYFNMTFSTIIDELRKNRRDNKRKQNNSHANITRTLDTSGNLSLVTQNSDKLSDLLKDIGEKYNLLYEPKQENTVISRLNYRPRRNAIWSANLDNIFPPFSLDESTSKKNALLVAPKIPLPLPPPPPPPKKKVFISREINGLKDILKLIDDFPLKTDIEYNIDMKILHNIDKPLRNLDSMIGMHKLKDAIVDQVIYFIQGLDKNNDFMHTVIYGPPGTGKTEVAKIMGSIFSAIGVLNKNTFKKVTRADLIAGYLGQTAIKTKDVIKSSLGGVLFIDEAYALGNSEKKDSFAKECIDTLCESLSDHKSKLMVIIAGYEIDLKKCFFAYNQGLDSRFPWRFHTDDYTGAELNKIFVKKIADINWTVKYKISDSWFESKMDYFKYFGRDMETLLAKTKIAHGRRVFCKPKNEKTVITKIDIDRGFEMFIANNEVKERKEEGSAIPFMYI